MTAASEHRPPGTVERGLMARFGSDRRGALAVVLALLVPTLLLIAGAGTDYAMAVSERAKAQQAADAAALAGAKELSLADSGRESVSAVVTGVINASLATNRERGTVPAYAITTHVNKNRGSQLQVEVGLSATLKSQFGAVFGLGDLPVTAKAVAVVVGRPNICLLALDPDEMGTIYLQKQAKVEGQNCAVFSNSAHPKGIKAFDSSVLKATTICSAGGATGSKANFEPQVLTDCPQFEDPLAGRPEPDVVGCDATNLVIDSQTKTLSPGTYCGGITLRGSARVTFASGTYIIKDGPLLAADTAAVSGANTSFFLVGNAARFSFATGTSIDLTAAKDGPLAGLLFFAARSQIGVQHEILSDNAHQLLGTIYVPTGTLSIDANQPIADKSAYTAIVARKVTANSGPTVTLNTNYDATDVPVPDGIRGAGQPVALAK